MTNSQLQNSSNQETFLHFPLPEIQISLNFDKITSLKDETLAFDIKTIFSQLNDKTYFQTLNSADLMQKNRRERNERSENNSIKFRKAGETINLALNSQITEVEKSILLDCFQNLNNQYKIANHVIEVESFEHNHFDNN